MILPFEFDIPIKSFNHHVSLLGALLSDKAALMIVYNTFISLRLNPNDYNYMAPMGFDRIARNYDIVLNMTAHFNFVASDCCSQERFIRINKALLDDGFYVDAYWDEFYIPYSIAYQKWHYNHNYVMYGYDDEYFYFAGYTKNQKPEMMKVTYDTFFLAAEKQEKTGYILRKYNRSYREEINPRYIAHELELYTEGQAEYYDGDTPTVETQRKLLVGIECMKLFIDQCSNGSMDRIDIKPMRTFFDHKCLMRDRIKCVYNYLNITDSEDVENLNEIASKMEKAFMLALKNRITNEKSQIERIVKIFQEICDEEKELYNKISRKIISMS